MSSNENVDDPWDVDFARDVPTTADDVEALWNARKLRPLTFQQYVAWATSIIGNKRPPSSETNSDSDKPFEL
ncbi:MAG: hypothetical protein QOJ98_36 [Acidobacteriota bacterium]|jgi:hypothetical protein|nr:hypothetical protein [Acidobacteriota bacterium]